VRYSLETREFRGETSQGRDLKANADMRAVIKGIPRDHLRANERALAQQVCPGSETIKPLAI